RFQKATQLWQEFVRANPGIVGFEIDLATFYFALVEFQPSLEERNQFMQKAHGLREKHARDHPGDPEHQLELARAQHSVAAGFYLSGKMQQAEQFARQALDRVESLATKYREVPPSRADLASHYAYLGLVLAGGNKSGAAE